MKPGALVSIFFSTGAALAAGAECAIAFATQGNEGQWALPFCGV
jgi:hypothetical protein